MIPLHQEFHVDLPIDQTWALLTDLPKVARCMPGASLDEVVDGEYRGGLSTKIGPISAKYRGVAVFQERDDVAHRAVIEARGREEKGSGSASALITTHLKPDGERTLVDVSTELAISGRAAQFGRSLLAEVSNSIVEEFVRGLRAMIAEDNNRAADHPHRHEEHTNAAPSVHHTPAEDAGAGQELDMLSTVVLPMLRRAAVPAATALIAGLVGVLIGRRGRRDQRSDLPLIYILPQSATTMTPGPGGH